ncbi:phage recombination protein Bet [Brevundimonas diminuta]|uniref:phage recombination protein Bet n=1 Tax=Brevundimonas diminuta TaxID=293 RepID=UPI000207ECF8|nr:phage recombination protein Bet [Brevundimonas diminuta]EGF96778.1 phage recombination protein Bet [Brevundimonas diminuta ATCC 11568]OWR16576.1 phage recombination protein Bet [Brevundimonas diminuta]WQE44814.1 phage recombination protein Bet [Brevundimonas diminuta]SUW17327.1 phage recombination protein Bet [Brevundimonas diminuta]
MNAIAIQGPRLPYHPAVEERFGVDQGSWRVLTDAVFPAAERPESIIMALAYCRARNLDIFKKPIQIVPIYDSKRRCMVDTVWPGIAELRTTAMRTGSFAGFDDTEYGPLVEESLSGVTVRYPEWAQCTVYRLIAGQRVPFVGPKVFWIETYATAKRDTKAPNSMWAKRPRGQLEKCAEAAALRRAFPEEIGNEYAAEEVEGQAFGGVRDVTPRQGPNLAARLAAPNDAPREGFSAIHGLSDDDHIPDFDADTPSDAASNKPASDPASDPSDAGDPFPGDLPPAEDTTASGAEADADEGMSLAVDTIAWADRLIADLPFLRPEQIAALETDRKELAKFAVLKATDMAKAREVEAAITAAKEG